MPEMAQPSNQPRNTDERQAPNNEIDIEKLADRVYRLMRDEARLERARGLSTKQGRKR